jgi:ABC-2 type transport system ATP-binding protein
LIGRRSTDAFSTAAEVSLQRVSGNPESRPALAALEARALSRRFGERFVLRDLDLRIEAGEGLALLGANGAGKTTFLRVAAGLLLPSHGELRIAGICPIREPERARTRIGFAMETSRLYPSLAVLPLLRFGARARGFKGAELEGRVAAVIERMALGAVAKRPVGNCSRGYQQRISLALALIGDPEILLVDEPSAGLDPAQREDLWDLLAALRGAHTLVVSTHDFEEAQRLAARAALLAEGRLAALGPTADLLANRDRLALFRAAPAQ